MSNLGKIIKINKKILIIIFFLAIIALLAVMLGCYKKHSIRNVIEESDRVYIIADDVEKEITDKSDKGYLKEIFGYLEFESFGSSSCPVSSHDAVKFENSKGILWNKEIVIYPSTDDCASYEINGNTYTTAEILKDCFKTIARNYGMKFMDDY